ncbi:hypothetical protein K439DRAFT_1400097 [Ramaria rubella]|nr:hypothetical protein K439DRAFT_1400097 [Ramaria rubella]
MALAAPAPDMTNNDSDKIYPISGHEVIRQDGPPAGRGDALEQSEHEKALETHEVVEINKFTERKEWIEEKIKLLESMPPIEVFASVDAFLSLSEDIPPGLPTRLQLDHWLEEHDRTEKETEIFDAEDMSKLKKLTKAATQRNLSPEDTDLIELTLTTLLALDRLLHLLRDRSESLDLLSLRIMWEEQRVAAWRERRSLINDLEIFLSNRARWSLETYEISLPSTPSPSPALRYTSPSPSPRPSSSLSMRRDSAASLASVSSDTSSTSPSVFSRSTRYKLAEILSHDAALFSGRLTALNHSKVMTAGKTLDRLIDISRKPVPDTILDEQDRLEDKAIKEIETIGKFAMTVVMQWKRADEHYNDTMKDQSAAQALIAELEAAKLHHPTMRHDAAFMSRAQALTKRLVVKGDPALARSSFPKPFHPLFPAQAASNEAIVRILSTELAEAVKLAREAEGAAQEYHARLEAVKRAEVLKEQMQAIDKQLEKAADKLIKGMHDGHNHGDASPPDLYNEVCLEPTRHATFLALLPSVVQDIDQLERVAEHTLHDSTTISLRLRDLPGIDPALKNDIVTTMQELKARIDITRTAKNDVQLRSQRLKEARHLWIIINDIMDGVENVKKQALQGLEGQRWKGSEGRHNEMPITPDSDSLNFSQTSLPVTSAPNALLLRLDALSQRLAVEFKTPMNQFITCLEKPLSLHFQASSDGLTKLLHHVQGIVQMWDEVIKQAEAMMTVQRDGQDLLHKVEALQTEVDDSRQAVLHGGQLRDNIMALENDYHSEHVVLQSAVRAFTDSLVTRMLLVSRTNGHLMKYTRSNSVSSSPSSIDHYHLNRLTGQLDLSLPFDLSALDRDVRASGNALALTLAGAMQSLAKKLDYLHLSHLAKIADTEVEGLAEELNVSKDDLSKLEHSLKSCLPSEYAGVDVRHSETLGSLVDHSDRVAQGHHTRLSQLSLNLRQSVQTLQAASGAHDSPVHGTIVIPRVKAMDDILQRTNAVSESLLQLSAQIVEAKNEEDTRVRLENERLEAAEKSRLEAERLEAEKVKQEEMRLQAEEESKREEGRLQPDKRASTEAAVPLIHKQSHAESSVAFNEKQASPLDTVTVNRTAPQPKTPDEDVFGRRLVPSLPPANVSSSQLAELRALIMSLRTRLRSLSIDSLVRPPSRSSGATMALPDLRTATETQSSLFSIEDDTADLPTTVEEDATANAELQSLRSELDAAHGMAQRLVQLGQVCHKVAACDHALSDLLEHADTYPAAPVASQLASSHVSNARLPCEEQLASRLAFTKGAMDEMIHAGMTVSDDPRVTAERARLQQTWSEISDMCTDRINGTRSRPASSVSSTGRISEAASSSSAQRGSKPSLTGNGPRPRQRDGTTRRTLSGVHDPISRPPTHTSIRSVSGPSGSSSLFNTTFASRQRTSSLASIQSATASPFKRPMSPISRPQLASKRPGSPAFSETSGHSLASTPSRSTWSRAPRQSFGTVPRNFQVHETSTKRKAYVANPRSKLDVAVGNVVNNFRLPVTIQAAGEGWRDQSGKYWIGDADPKLCFCRILRSHTVMVRVGGGWSELSKFLRGHFADLLAELPPSPPRKEERWINAATVRESMGTPTVKIRESTTPEPKGQGQELPTLQLSTPNGNSPQSLKTASSPGGGSPGLTPFQFMRRADAGLRPVTPSPTKSTRPKPVTPGVTPSRTNVWRP